MVRGITLTSPTHHQLETVSKQTLPTLGKCLSEPAGCSLLTLTKGTDGDWRGGLRADPGVVFSATFLILRTVFKPKTFLQVVVREHHFVLQQFY